jgi:hypothetical protein
MSVRFLTAGIACTVFLTPMFLSTAISSAKADAVAPSSAQVDALIEDINAHKQLCDKVTVGDGSRFKQCTNEQASLVARQQKLGVSNEALNGKLQARGWRWP